MTYSSAEQLFLKDKSTIFNEVSSKFIPQLLQASYQENKTIVDTFEKLFSEGKAYLKALGLNVFWDEEQTYPVIRQDFSKISCSNLNEIRQDLLNLIKAEFTRLGFDVDGISSSSPTDFFSAVMVGVKTKVVFIFENYDFMFIKAKEASDDLQREINVFYQTLSSVVKANAEQYGRFTLLTVSGTLKNYGAILGPMYARDITSGFISNTEPVSQDY